MYGNGLDVYKRQKYGFEVFLLHQLVDGSGFSDHYIRLKLNAQFFYFLDLFFEDVYKRQGRYGDYVSWNLAKSSDCIYDQGA